MSEETSRSDDSAPSLSSYPPAFVSLINTFIKRSEDAETRAHKALVVLKDKDTQVAELQQKVESLESIASRMDVNLVPPLELPQSPSSSNNEKEKAHPREFEAQLSRAQYDDTLLETLYERLRTPPKSEEEGPGDCYAKCQQLLAEMQRSNQRLKETKEPRIVSEMSENVSKNSKDKLACEPELSSDMNMNVLNIMSNDHSRNRYDLVVIDKEDVKQNVDMAKSIIHSLQKRLEEEDCKKSPVKGYVPAGRGLCLKSSRSSVSSYHTPKSKISSRFLIRRRKTTHCFFSSLNRAHKKLRLKYHHVYEKFKESLTLCGKLQDDIVYLTEYQNGSREVNVEMLDKQTQTQVATRGSTSLLQGRLDAASQAMRSRLAELQELKNQLDDRQSLVASLKKRLSRAEAEAAMKEAQLVEAAATNASQAMQLQHYKLQLSEMSTARQHLADEKAYAYRKELEEMKRSMELKITELEVLLENKDSTSAQAIGDLESKLKRLKGQLMMYIVEAGERLTAADAKIHQLYLAIQKFLEMVFGLWRNSYGERITARGQSDVEMQAIRVASEILQLPPTQLTNILQPSTNVNKWLRKCRKLVFEEEFAERLGCLLVDAVCEAKNS